MHFLRNKKLLFRLFSISNFDLTIKKIIFILQGLKIIRLIRLFSNVKNKILILKTWIRECIDLDQMMIINIILWKKKDDYSLFFYYLFNKNLKSQSIEEHIWSRSLSENIFIDPIYCYFWRDIDTIRFYYDDEFCFVNADSR